MKDGRRDELRAFLAVAGIPSMIYYPLPLQDQEAFRGVTRQAETLTVASALAASVLSLPMHTELTPEQQDFIIGRIKEFYC